MIPLSQAVDNWNSTHPYLNLQPQNKGHNKQIGLGSTIFASYSHNHGWTIVQVGCGNSFLAFIARLLRYLHLAYHDTRLNWNFRRKTDWINQPQDSDLNPIAEFKSFFKNPIEEQQAFIKRVNLQCVNGLTETMREGLLVELNHMRQKMDDVARSSAGDVLYSNGIKELETVAACQLVRFCHKKNSAYGIHHSMMQERHTDKGRAFFKWDNQITAHNGIVVDSLPVVKIGECAFEQRAALHQIDGENLLCGYYALFNFLQDANNTTLIDREKVEACFKDWTRKICSKRFLASLQNRKREDPFEDIPLKCLGIPKGPIGLSLDEIKHLIMHSSLFQEIIQNQEWQIIELDNVLSGEDIVIHPVFPSDRPIPKKLSANTPIHLIVKYEDHYLYFKALVEKGERCHVSQLIGAHSLGYSILESFGVDNLSLLIKVVEEFYSC